MIDLNDVEEDLQIAFDADRLVDASRDDTARIVDAARDGAAGGRGAARCRRPVLHRRLDAAFLSGALAGAFPDAQPVFGDRLASVATGLGIHAQRLFG